MIENNKRLVRQFYDELWNRGHIAIADELVAEGTIRHDPAGPVAAGPAGFAANVARIRRAIPDLVLTIDLMLAEDDLVAARWTITGRHDGALESPLGVIPPSQRDISFSGVNIFRIAGGKVAEIWNHRDDLAFLRQIGAVP